MNAVLAAVNLPKETWQWISVLCALFITVPQGIWMFRNAQKRGRFPWLWGLWGIISAPLPLIVYYIFVIRHDKKHNKKPM